MTPNWPCAPCENSERPSNRSSCPATVRHPARCNSSSLTPVSMRRLFSDTDRHVWSQRQSGRRSGYLPHSLLEERQAQRGSTVEGAPRRGAVNVTTPPCVDCRGSHAVLERGASGPDEGSRATASWCAHSSADERCLELASRTGCLGTSHTVDERYPPRATEANRLRPVS